MPKKEEPFVPRRIRLGGYMAADVLPNEVDPPPADWLASASEGARPESPCSCKAESRSDADGDTPSSEN